MVFGRSQEKGYLSKFLLYQRKEKIVVDFINFGFGERVVLNLKKLY